MKTLVVYASKKGFTQSIALQIAEGIKDGSKAVNIKREVASCNLGDYDACIIGGYVHAGRMAGALRSWCVKHTQTLLEKKLGFFICGLDEENYEKTIGDAFPAELVKHASEIVHAGARLVLKDYNPIVQAILKKITKSDQDLFLDRPEAVKKLIEAFSS